MLYLQPSLKRKKIIIICHDGVKRISVTMGTARWESMTKVRTVYCCSVSAKHWNNAWVSDIVNAYCCTQLTHRTAAVYSTYNSYVTQLVGFWHNVRVRNVVENSSSPLQLISRFISMYISIFVLQIYVFNSIKNNNSWIL